MLFQRLLLAAAVTQSRCYSRSYGEGLTILRLRHKLIVKLNSMTSMLTYERHRNYHFVIFWSKQKGFQYVTETCKCTFSAKELAP